MSKPNSVRMCSITMTSCSTGPIPSAILASPMISVVASTMSLSTSIRTQTGSRRPTILALKPGGQGLTVIGDDAQSIYSFRAATVRNILDFPAQFSPPAEIITLERNYRSTQAILAAANGVIGVARERFTKNLGTDRASGARPQLVTVRDEADQARCIVERVLQNREAGALLKQ